MTIGDRIKQRRKELDMSVDQLADILGKNRATIYRYESDEIENLSITVLEPLAKVLKTSPEYLMGWSAPHIKPIAELVKESASEYNVIKHDDEYHRLLTCFNKLSYEGKLEAIKRVEELTFIPSYCDGGK